MVDHSSSTPHADPHGEGRRLRSRRRFDDPADPAMTAMYLERFMNYGISPDELRGGKPIIGIAQTGSNLSPCNRHHLELVSRIRDGIRDAGGVALEFPVHPIQQTGKRPTAALDRNLAYLGLVEILHGYSLDGAVMTTGCDKTTPACLMAAATVNIPAIVLSGCTAIPAPYRERGRMAFETGKRIVGMVAENLRPSDITTKAPFENAAVDTAALGASSNGPIHMVTIARHMGVEHTLDDWQRLGPQIPLLVDCQQAGQFLGEKFHRAGGVPAVMKELQDAEKLQAGARTVTGRTLAEDLACVPERDREVICASATPPRRRRAPMPATWS